jgi:phosphohistidine phosphatase SixA
MLLFLVRHGDAGERGTWVGDDSQRPLDEAGRRQAEGLIGALDGRELDRIFSSPYLRCTQTVEPLALARRLPIEHRPELAEGARKDGVYALLKGAGKREAAVLCTHGDVIESVLGRESEKGSTWMLEHRAGKLVPVEYLPPPG